MGRGAPAGHDSSVAHHQKQDSLGLQVIDFPIPDFSDLPQKGQLATESGMALWSFGQKTQMRHFSRAYGPTITRGSV